MQVNEEEAYPVVDGDNTEIEVDGGGNPVFNEDDIRIGVDDLGEYLIVIEDNTGIEVDDGRGYPDVEENDTGIDVEDGRGYPVVNEDNTGIEVEDGRGYPVVNEDDVELQLDEELEEDDINNIPQVEIQENVQEIELHDQARYLDLYDEDEGIQIVQDGDDDDEEGIQIVQDDDDEIPADQYDYYIREDDNNDDSSGEDEKGVSPKKTTFDISLPNSHSYMGENMEELKGRTIHTEGEMVIMPLFYQPGVVLVPGQILPLNLFHPQPISMMKKVIAADKTFGLMMSRSYRSRNSLASIGVTCEIYSVREETVHGVEQMSLKGEGRQRFRILSKQYQMDGVIMGKILILPDAPIPPYPQCSLIYSQHRRNAIASQVINNNFFVANKKWKFGEARYLNGFNIKDQNVLCKSTSAMPGWVYKLYNPYFLMDCLMKEISSWNQHLCIDNIPIHPTDFSHWITANLPLTNEMKIQLLEIDSVILRLRRQIVIMSKCTTTLACNECLTTICDKADLFSLSKKGPMAAYVNPNGAVHETVTFYTAKNIELQGRAQTEYSWFPGYAWTIALCKSCKEHLGWKFTRCKKELEPSKFFGLSRSSLKPVFKETESEDKKVVDRGGLENLISNPVMYESNI